jgi:hypothetical protein
MRLGELGRIPLSYPTYARILVRAAVKAASACKVGWQSHEAA